MKIVNEAKAENIPEVLTKVEYNDKGISMSLRRIQLNSRLKVVWKYRRLSAYFLIGILKLLILKMIPYRIILSIKRKIYL